MDDLAAALDDAGGVAAGRERAARLRGLLGDALRRGAAELAKTRSGYGDPVTVAIAPAPEGLRAVAPVAPEDAELVRLALEGHIASVDRLRARAVAVPSFVLEDAADFRAPIGAAHPLVVAARVAALGGRPADQASLAGHEDAVLAALDAAADGA